MAELLLPAVVEAQYSLGTMLKLLGELAAGLEHIQRATALAPDNVQVCLTHLPDECHRGDSMLS